MFTRDEDSWPEGGKIDVIHSDDLGSRFGSFINQSSTRYCWPDAPVAPRLHYGI